MKTIILFGTEYKVAFNLATQRSFEAMAGVGFDLTLLSHQKHRINLYISAIITNNDMSEDEVSDFTRKFLYDLTFDELKEIDTVVNEVLTSWYNIPSSAKIEHKSEDDDEKNA